MSERPLPCNLGGKAQRPELADCRRMTDAPSRQETTLSGPRRLKKQSFNFLASGGVCKLPSRITQTGHGLSSHEAARPKYEATPMAITTGMTTPRLANNMVTATRWPMD